MSALLTSQPIAEHVAGQRGGRRVLSLIAPGLPHDYPEIQNWARSFGWSVFPDAGIVSLPLGDGAPWQNLTQFVDALRNALNEKQLVELRAAWLRPGQPLSEQLHALVHARPVLSMVPFEGSPLSEILKEKRIETWFQPVVRALDHEVWGYECLMRGRTADGDLILPERLFQWASQERLLFILDRICRETHLYNAGRAGLPPGCNVLINFLPAAVYDPKHCLQTSIRAAYDSGLSPEQVTFEVVETHQVDDPEHLRGILDYYRSHGFRVALDDVGAGYAGLSLMAELQPDLVKLDAKVVRKSEHNAAYRDVCASVIELAHKGGHRVVAEGIETPEQCAVMEALGVDLLQGFLFGRPAAEPAGCRLSVVNLPPSDDDAESQREAAS
ncbi:MAG: EAL domain-containing protein [Phycisphaerae bacterium]|nr:EAL domain-containing protein [Phycisphaerae bacterium]NUQ47895.1 EAL domain-containing protein [Phycisphaerae bacterium]